MWKLTFGETYPLQLLVRQADTVLNTDLVADTTVLAQDSNALDLDAVLDDAGGMAADGGRGTLNTSPGTDAATPSDDRVENTSVMLDLRVLEHDTLLDTGTSTNSDARSNAHVRTELGSRVNFGGRVNEDRGNDVGARSCKLFAGFGLGGLLKVEGVGGNSRASGLDLAPEVLGLVDVELLAVGHVGQDVLLQTNDLALLLLIIVVVVRNDVAVLEVVGRGVRNKTSRAVEATLDGGSNGREDGLSGEEVDTTVDEVADTRLRLLDVVENTASVRVGDNATEVCSSLVAHTGSENDGLGILVVEKLEHLLEGKRAADIGVEDEESLRAALEDSIAEVVETTSRSKSLVLAQVLDGDGGELLGGVLDEIAEDGLVVVADNVDLLDLLVGDASDGRQAVPDDRVTGDFEQRLGHVERQRTESSSSRRATDLRIEAISILSTCWRGTVKLYQDNSLCGAALVAAPGAMGHRNVK